MLRYLEDAGLVAPTPDAGRLPPVRPPRAEPASLAPRAAPTLRRRARRARVRAPAAARARVARARSTRGSPAGDDSALAGSSGSSASTSGCSSTDEPTYTAHDETRIHGNDQAIRREGPRARRRRRAPHRVGRPADAGAAGDPRALRAREAARRLPHLRLPARDDRDGEPHAHAEGGRRRRRALRVEPALDAGRRRRGARRRVRHLGLRDQGRGQRHVLPAHRGRGRPQAAADDGRRRRRDRRPAQRTGASSSATSSPAWRRRRPASSG